MNKKEHINYWLNSAEHDYDVMQSLFKNNKYDWCLFIGHLVIEKTLKSFWVRDNEDDTPPRIHNLLKLVEQTKLQTNEDQKLFLLNINDFNLEVRYPDYKLKFYKKCNKDFTSKNYIKIKGFYKWLKKQI
jgi:HEPN domain-containing protein